MSGVNYQKNFSANVIFCGSVWTFVKRPNLQPFRARPGPVKVETDKLIWVSPPVGAWVAT